VKKIKIKIILAILCILFVGCTTEEQIVEEAPLVDGGELPLAEESVEDIIEEPIIEPVVEGPIVEELINIYECDYNKDGKVNKIEKESCINLSLSDCKLNCLNGVNGSVQRKCLEGC
jgi:hypothetical protein|tara:strand:- start:382 stop:732 length:351 start_codon:yes stop_codon:yes gene_type:complete